MIGREDIHPLAVNFKKLRKYNFQRAGIDEILFFEWLIVKQKSFGDQNEFFYQTNRVIKEIGIKRSRLETIKSKFLDYGLIIENKGPLNTTHYLVTIDFIGNYVQDHILPEYQEVYLGQVRTINFKGRGNLSEIDVEETLILINDLNSIYNDERRMFNKINGEAQSLDIKLDYNDKTIYQCNLLRERYDEQTIFRVFEIFVEFLLEEKDSTTHLLNNFSSYDNHLNGFPVFSRYNRIYSQSVTPF